MTFHAPIMARIASLTQRVGMEGLAEWANGPPSTPLYNLNANRDGKLVAARGCSACDARIYKVTPATLQRGTGRWISPYENQR